MTRVSTIRIVKLASDWGVDWKTCRLAMVAGRGVRERRREENEGFDRRKNGGTYPGAETRPSWP